MRAETKLSWLVALGGVVFIFLIATSSHKSPPPIADSVIDSVLSKSTPPAGLISQATNVQGYDRAFVECALTKAQQGQYSSSDGGDSAAKLMNDECLSESDIWQRFCEQAGNPQRTCSIWVAAAAQMSIKQLGK